MLVDAPALLPIGHRLDSHSRSYEIVAIEPYTRKDGEPTWLYRLRGLCRNPDCSEIVEFSNSVFLITRNFSGNTCSAHHGWYDKHAAAEARRAGMKKYQASLSCEERAERKATRLANLARGNANITPEQRAERARKGAETYRRNWAKLSPAERTAIQKKRAAGKKRKSGKK